MRRKLSISISKGILFFRYWKIIKLSNKKNKLIKPKCHSFYGFYVGDQSNGFFQIFDDGEGK